MDIKGSLNELLEQAKLMQDKMKTAQDDLLSLTVIGEAGGGMVKIEMNGRHDVKRVTINDAAMSDKEMLEGLVAAAINDANKKIERKTQEKMGDLTKGMKLPEGFDLPGGTDDEGSKD